MTGKMIGSFVEDWSDDCCNVKGCLATDIWMEEHQ